TDLLHLGRPGEGELDLLREVSRVERLERLDGPFLRVDDAKAHFFFLSYRIAAKSQSPTAPTTAPPTHGFQFVPSARIAPSDRVRRTTIPSSTGARSPIATSPSPTFTEP